MRHLTHAQGFPGAIPWDAALPALVSFAITLPPHVLELRRSGGRSISLERFLAPHAAQLTSLRLLHPSFFEFYGTTSPPYVTYTLKCRAYSYRQSLLRFAHWECQ